jgi:hypothetical protein
MLSSQSLVALFSLVTLAADAQAAQLVSPSWRVRV